jgi:hypothetical protein
MERFSPQVYMTKQASNEILSNMKVEHLALTFPKSPRTWISHVWLRRYGSIMVKQIWTSQVHNFWTISPIEMVLFAAFLFWHVLSNSCIISHAFWSQKYLTFHLNFGGKVVIQKLCIAFTFYQLHLALNSIWSDSHAKTVYCCIELHTWGCICKLAITLGFH